jgi:2-polyprenyl-3-methyl-5-hydroxy-6-metoxy-1,4-benzoquinol methylase
VSQTCLLCKSNRIVSFHEDVLKKMLSCKQCGFVFNQTLNSDAYQDSINIYYESVDPHNTVALSRKNIYQHVLDKCLLQLGSAGKVLDVGCGTGEFLLLAKQLGWNVNGVEIVEKLAKQAVDKCGQGIQCSGIIEATLEENKFDVITFFNTFDEIPNIFLCLEKVKKALKPGGILFIRVPNYTFHRLVLLMRKGWLKNFVLVDPIFHIYNFSSGSICRLLKNQGFSNVSVKNALPTEGDPYTQRKAVSFLKKMVYFLSQGIYWISFKNIIIAPSLEVFITNDKN